MPHIRPNFEGSAVPFAKNLPELAQVQTIQLLGEDRFKSDSNWFIFDLVKRTAQLPGRIFRGIDNFEVAIPVKMFNCIWKKLNKVEEEKGLKINPVLKAVVAGLPALPLIVLSAFFLVLIRLPVLVGVSAWALVLGTIPHAMRTAILWIVSLFQGESSSKVDEVAQKKLGTKSAASSKEAIENYYQTIREISANPKEFIARDTLARQAFEQLKSRKDLSEIQAQIFSEWKANTAIMSNPGYAALTAEEVMDHLEDFPACEAAQLLANPAQSTVKGTIVDPATMPKNPSKDKPSAPAASLEMSSEEFANQALALQNQREKLARQIKNAESDLDITKNMHHACFKAPIRTGTPSNGFDGTIASRLAPRQDGYFQPVIAEYAETAISLAEAVVLKEANLEGLKKELTALQGPETQPPLANPALSVFFPAEKPETVPNEPIYDRGYLISGVVYV